MEEKYKNLISEYYDDLCDVIKNIDINEIDMAVQAVYKAYINEKNIYVFGNGGSASTASHMANDFNKGISYKLDKKFNMQCLNDNIATIMAIANDIDYSDVFVEQLKGKLKGDELIIAISGSGNSKNVIKAVDYAKECGCKIIGMSGYDGGLLKEKSDYHMHANINDMQIVEDVHLVFNHMMMRIFCRTLKEN